MLIYLNKAVFIAGIVEFIEKNRNSEVRTFVYAHIKYACTLKIAKWVKLAQIVNK